HVLIRDQRLARRDRSLGQHHVFVFIARWRDDRRALVDLRRIEQVEYRQMLHLQDLVHAFQTQRPLGIQEVRDVRLLEAGLLREFEAGELALFHPLADHFAKVLLKLSEFHVEILSHGYKACKCNIAKEIKFLTDYYSLDTG